MSGSSSARPPQPPCGGGVARAAGGGAGTARGRVTTRRSPLRNAPVPVPPSHEQQGMSMADDWPLHSYLELGALPSAVPCARHWTAQLLWEWGLTDLSYQVELLISELVTNGVAASRAMKQIFPVRLWLLSDKTRVVILVWDGNPQRPVRLSVHDEAESGRGLVLVEALSDKWNWYAHEGLGGKVVWCQVSLGPAQKMSSRNPSEGR